MLRRYPKSVSCKGSAYGPSPFKSLGVIASYPALALTVSFFVVTCYVLFFDVWSGAPITTDHVLSFAVLVGTFASGHLMWGQRFFPALGLLLLFVAGTFYCVTSAGGRNAASSGAKAELVHKSNDDRARVEADLRDAKGRLRESLEAEEVECGSGEGPKCQARRKTRQERETYRNVLEAQLRLMDPAKSEYPELRHAAKVFASVVSASEQSIFDRLVLWFPFVKALFCEIATLVFGSIAIRHSKETVDRETIKETVSRKTSLKTVARKPIKETVSRLGFLGKPTVAKARKPFSKDEALADLLALVSERGSLPSQEVLRERYGLGSKGTVSKWLTDWEDKGLIIRSQQGRCKEVSLGRLESIHDFT